MTLYAGPRTCGALENRRRRPAPAALLPPLRTHADKAPMASAHPCGRSAVLFDRLPERLVLDGFRRWMAGYSTGDLGHWEAGLEPACRCARNAQRPDRRRPAGKVRADGARLVDLPDRLLSGRLPSHLPSRMLCACHGSGEPEPRPRLPGQRHAPPARSRRPCRGDAAGARLRRGDEGKRSDADAGAEARHRGDRRPPDTRAPALSFDRTHRSQGRKNATSHVFSIAAALGLTSAAIASAARAAEAPDPAAVLKTYGDIGAAMYGDALIAAKDLQARSMPSSLIRPTRRSPRRATPGRSRACPTCRPRVFASATLSSTTGRAT